MQVAQTSCPRRVHLRVCEAARKRNGPRVSRRTGEKTEKMNFLLQVLLVLFNVFFLDRDPRTCARYHAQKHLNKMIVEYAQACCAAWHKLKKEGEELPEGLYRLSNANHPITKWVCESRAHYLYLIELGLALCAERSERRARAPREASGWKLVHKSEHTLRMLATRAPSNFPHTEWQRDPPLLAPQDVQDMQIEDRVEANRMNYMLHKLKIKGNVYLPFVDIPEWAQQ